MANENSGKCYIVIKLIKKKIANQTCKSNRLWNMKFAIQGCPN